MKKLFNAIGISAMVIAVAAMLMVAVPQHASAVGPTNLSYSITAPAGSDPCQNPSVLKQSASFSVTTAATTAVVTPIAGDFISVCRWQLNAVGTSPTIQFEYGTVASTACDTGATVLTGAVPVATTTTYTGPGGDGLLLRVGVVSQELCIVSGGTLSGTGVTGFVTYVQAPY